MTSLSDLTLQVPWSGSGNLVAITTNDSYYILSFDRDAYTAALESGTEISDEGVEEAIELVTEVADRQVSKHLSHPCVNDLPV